MTWFTHVNFEGRISPLQGFSILIDRLPRAAPWAIASRPFRARRQHFRRFGARRKRAQKNQGFTPLAISCRPVGPGCPCIRTRVVLAKRLRFDRPFERPLECRFVDCGVNFPELFELGTGDVRLVDSTHGCWFWTGFLCAGFVRRVVRASWRCGANDRIAW